MAERFKLKIKSLKFLSAVDAPAQADAARALLLKRAGAHDEVKLTARTVKTMDELGLVFGYAFASSLDGGETPYVDLQRDAIEPDFLKAAMEFIEAGGATDVNHDRDQDGRVVFAWPLVPEINEAMGITAKTVGLAVAVKPSAETFEAFKRGDLTGFSIDGIGIREEMKRKTAPKGDREKFEKIAEQLRREFHAAKSMWSMATVDDLPDSSFLYIEGGGKKDDEGKTTPRSLRHFPYKDASGKVDLPHLRDAIGRIPQSSLPATLREKLQAKAEKLLGQQHEKDGSSKSVRKMVVLTSVIDGHQHAIDLDDPADWCGDKLCTSPATSEGADNPHAHAWTFDKTTGAVTIAMDSGHDHAVSEAVPPNVLSMFVLGEQQEAQEDAQRLIEQVLDGNAPGNVTVSVTASANSTPSTVKRDGGHVSKEQKMPDEIADLKKQLAHAQALASLNDAQRAHYKSLSGQAAETFLAKSFDDREKDVAVVYTCKATGQTYRASDDPRMVEMAKQLDKRDDDVAKRDADIEKQEIRKLATETLGALAGGDEVHDLIIGALRKSGADKAKLEAALTAMRGWNAMAKTAERVKGADPGRNAEPGSALDAYQKGLETFAKAEGKKPLEVAEKFLRTEEGKTLYAAYQAEHPAYQHTTARQ